MWRRLSLFAVIAALAWLFMPSLTLTIAALLVLITLHEGGHLLVARWCGIGTPEFSVGFGPQLAARQGRRTLWVLRAVPLGGYVRLSGQGGDGDDWQQAGSLRRVAVAVAGPAVNITFGAMLFFAALCAGGSVETTGRIGTVYADSPAAELGLVAGDRVTQVDGRTVRTYEELFGALTASGPVVALRVVHADGTVDSYRAELQPLPDGRRVLGVGPETRRVPLAVGDAAAQAASTTGRFVRGGVGQIGTMVKILVQAPLRVLGVLPLPAPKERALSPVGLAAVVESSARDSGVAGVLWLLGAVSVFIGVFNLLPVAPLDGGKIVGEPLTWAARRLGLRGRFPSLRQAATTAVVVLVVLGGLSSLLLDVLSPISMP